MSEKVNDENNINDATNPRKILLSRLKELLLDEVDEIVVGLFSQANEFPYWQNSPDSRLKAEFKATVENMWVLLSCVSLTREQKQIIAFECGKALVKIYPEDLRVVTKQYKLHSDSSKLCVFLQNLEYLKTQYGCDRFKVEKFLTKLHETKLFETTRLDRYCENWEAADHQKLQFSLRQRWYKRTVAWMCEKEEESKKFIAEQMNSRANTLLKDQLRMRTRESFVKSNHHEDACCFEDIFYILQGVNESQNAEVSDCPISKEKLVHGNSTVEESCRKILNEIQKKKQQISHVYLLKNDVHEGVMGHWTVLCYERIHDASQWRLCDYFNPSGQGFRCGDRCIQWVLNHAHQHKYISLPKEVISKLHVRGTEREITWDMTEMTKQLSECVNVEIPTYVMKDDGDLVNLLSIESEEEEEVGGGDEEDSSSFDSEDYDWEYVPSVVEVLQSSFTEQEINLFLSKHGFDRSCNVSEAVQKICS